MSDTRLREWAREHTEWPVNKPIPESAYTYLMFTSLEAAGAALVRWCAEIARLCDEGEDSANEILRAYGLSEEGRK